MKCSGECNIKSRAVKNHTSPENHTSRTIYLSCDNNINLLQSNKVCWTKLTIVYLVFCYLDSLFDTLSTLLRNIYLSQLESSNKGKCRTRYIDSNSIMIHEYSTCIMIHEHIQHGL